MSIKDLFNDYKSNQFSPAQSELSASKLAESNEFIQNKFVEKFRYEPPINFATASNFAKFGSAELYYEYAFKRIYQQYPYDGTLAEQQEFHNNSTFLDKYIFDNIYPRTAGHIKFSSDGWGTMLGALSSSYGLSNNIQYISVFGGPHTASGGMTGKDLAVTFDNSMIYDESKNRVGSFDWNPISGSTIEFWMKKKAFDNSKTQKEVILDIWNQDLSSSPGYGRITLELANITGNDPILLTMMSGASGFSNLSIANGSLTSGDITDNKWHHYAVTMQNVGPNTEINLYRDGTYLSTVSHANQIQKINNVSGGVNAYIGALQTSVSGTTTAAGWGKLSASLDEFRYWKKRRTTNEIGEFWFTNLGGGTNKREYNTDLGVYFKFNEGITGVSTTDQNILDYSGRISNGIMVGYTASARSTESAFETLANVEEYKDPIIYSSHPDVSSSLVTFKTTGSIQDFENTSLLYNLFPSWIIEEDRENGQNLRYLTQIMASYFDTLNAQISGITEFKSKRYFSGSMKPNTYAREVLRGQGFVMPDIFIEADILEEMRGKDDNETYNGDIQKIKNLIYQNIYNNLNYIYKSKGTEKSFRNLFRCFGIDSEILKLNLYSDNSTYLYKDNYEFTSIAKPVLNLNKESQIDGTVYLSSSNGNTFIKGSEGDNEQLTSITFECESIFPHKFEPFETGYFPTPYTSASIAGFHRALTSSVSDFTWHPIDDTSLRMYAVKQTNNSRHAKFVLTGSIGFELTSSLYKNVFDNNKWILAARVKHTDYPYASGSNSDNYIVEFYGVNSVANDVKNEFSISANVSNAVGKKLLGHVKRIYAGSHRQNFTGSVLQNSEVKVSQVRFWQSHLSNEEIREHSFDPTNYGLMHPYRSDAIFQVSGSETVYVPQIETLALHWDFMNVTSSDSNGRFVVNDISSGSTSFASKYSMIGNITKNKYDGYAEFFDTSSVNVVDKEFIYTAKKRLPDEVYSSDGVKIKTEETESFFEDDDVADHFYMFEKSPYNAVSQQMINFFGSMKDFNSLIGDPAERYRFQYKQMEDLKRIFFERVENVPDPERFFEYFKWIDTSVSYAISQLIPASSRFADEIKDVVESHILERNKYQEKFPLVAQQRSTEGVIKSFSEISYNWKFGHAPLDGSDNKNCLWQKIRRRVDDTNVQSLRDNIYKTSNTKLNKLFDIKTSQVYEGNTDAVRRLSRPYKLDMELKQNIHGGTNYYVAKNRDFLLEAVHPHGEITSLGIPKNVLVVGVGEGQGLIPETVCQDEENNEVFKEKYKFDGVDGRFSSDQQNAPISEFASYKNFIKGIATFPMNIMSQSVAVNTGYQAAVSSSFNKTAYITNLHSDTVDRTNAVPMQGPFTERHVGGHQSRHVSINKFDTSLIDDETGNAPPNNIHNLYTRPEAYRLLLGENPSNAIVDGALGFTPPDYGVSLGTGSYPDTSKKRASFYREEKAKRPVNIKNIKHRESGSVVGNYKNNYEFMMLQGRRENNLYFRDNPEITNYLPVRFTSSLPHTTHVMSLVGIDPVVNGNVFGTHTNNMQPDAQLVTPATPGSPANGSFSVSGSTITGSNASGSFRLNRQVVNATPAKFSFDVSGSNFAGTKASGSFSFARNTTPAVSASIQFSVKGRTIQQVESSGSFVITGSRVDSRAATASFDVAGLPVGGERSYAIFDVGYENIQDSHTFSLGRASSTWAVEMEIFGGVTGGNQSVSPFSFRKAATIVSSSTNHYTGAVDADSSNEAILEFYFYADPNPTNNADTKYIYQSKGNYGSSKFSDPAPVVEVFFAGNTTSPTVKQYFKNTNNGDTQGFFLRTGDAITSGWNRIMVVTKRSGSGELYIEVNGNPPPGGETGTNVDASDSNNVSVAPIEHKIMGDGSGQWSKDILISNMIYWNTVGHGASAPDICDLVAPNQFVVADTAFSSSNIRARYTFGDNTSDTVQYIYEDTRNPNLVLTASWNASGDSFVNSNFVQRKTPTVFFNDVKNAINSNSNSSFFDVNYVTYNSSSTEAFQTKWPATSSAIVLQPSVSTPDYQVNDEYSLNFARFFVVASSENATSNYQIAPVINTGSFTNELSMSFKNLTFDGTGSAQLNSTVNSIEDTSITIDGDVITFDHHANSQTSNKVRTHSTSYHPSLSGSAMGSNYNLKNNSYPSAGSLIASSDISISLWHARSSTSTGQEYLVLLDSTDGGAVAGAISVKTTNTTIQIDAYQNYSTYKRFSATFSSLGINEDDLNHYVFTFDRSSLTGVLYVNGRPKSLTTSGTATSFSHTFTEIRLANALGGNIYELQGRLCQVSIWDKILTANEAHEIYHDGRIKDLYGHSAVHNLVHWYKLGTEAGWPSVGSDLSGFLTIPDSTSRFQKVDLTLAGGGASSFTSENGLPNNTLTDSAFYSALDTEIDIRVTDYNASRTGGSFTVTNTSTGYGGNGDSLSEDSDLISNLETTSGGGATAGGAADGDSITIDGIRFELDTNSSVVDSSTLKGINCSDGVSNTTFWNTLSQSIKDHTDFDTVSIADNGNTAKFSLTASTGGSSNNSVILNASSSFSSIVQTAGGVNQSGSVQGHQIVLKASSDAAEQFTFIVDNDGGNVDGTPARTFYITGATATNAEFWNNLSSSIKQRGFGGSYSSGSGQVTFTITSFLAGAAGNSSVDSTETGDTFTFITSPPRFVSGSNVVDNNDTHTFSLDGVTFEMDSNGSFTGGRTNIASSGSLTNTQVFNNITASIKAQTVFDTISYSVSSSTATFEITSSVTGATKNGSFLTGSGFTLINQTAGGTNTSGSQYGNTLVIGNHGSNVTITVGSGSSPDASLTNVAWWNDLSQSIKSGTNYDHIRIADKGNHATFHLTSSISGASGNDTHSETGTTFFNLVNSTGGSDAGDPSDGSFITIEGKVFVLDSDGSFSGHHVIASSASLSDNQVFNALTQSIKDNTVFDVITMSPSSGNNRVLNITSSISGSSKNSAIGAVSGSFTIIANTAGGTNESGSKDGHTITIGGQTFELDNNSSTTGGNRSVNCSDSLSNAQFWNTLSQSIKDHTVFDTITYSASATTAVFELTSSTTGSSLNVPISRTGSSFTVIRGMQGGSNAVPATFTDLDVVLAVPTPTLRNGDKNKTIISSRFAAPGGVEIESNAYLDVYARELSVHNALPFRNLTVRTDSGENNHIRINDHLGKRRGLNSLLALHSGQFGIDSTFGSIVKSTYSVSGSFNKQHRNRSKRMEFSGSSVITGSLFDNAFVSTPIPRSEFQYSWINNTISGSNWENGQLILGYQPVDGVLEFYSKASGSVGMQWINTFLSGGDFDVDPATIVINDGAISVQFELSGDSNADASGTNIVVRENDAGGAGVDSAERYTQSLALAINNSNLNIIATVFRVYDIKLTHIKGGSIYNINITSTSESNRWAPNITGMGGGGQKGNVVEAIVFPSSSNIT